MAQENINPLIAFEDVRIIETDETSWIRIGDSFVNTDRIQAVGLNEERQVELILEDGAFARPGEGVTLEDVMTLIVEATVGDDEDDEDDH